MGRLLEALGQYRNYSFVGKEKTSKPTTKKGAEKKPAVRSKATAEKKSTPRKPEVKRGKPTLAEKSKPQAKKTVKTERTLISRRKGTVAGVSAAALATALAVGYIGYKIGDNGNENEVIAGSTTTEGTTTTTEGATTTTQPQGTTTTTEGQSEGFQVSPEAEAFMAAWPKTPEEAVAMFGGTASDWMKNPDWTGDRKALSLFYKGDYFPIEWRPTNPDNAPYYWPKTPEEAVIYFFPGQELDPSWLRPNQYGAWELMQDHWRDGYLVDMTAIIHPGVVAEGYTVLGDDVAENDRNFVAWGGVINGVNGGISLPLVNGQGMTLWPPGTNPNKIGIEGKPYNIPYYKGADGEQLGPIAINFPPIYPAPTNG